MKLADTDTHTPYQANARRGFTLMEVMISLTLFILLSIGVLGSITTLHSVSRRQATYHSASALVMQELETIRSLNYSPPNTPFTVNNTELKKKKSVSLNSSGTDYMVDVTIVSIFELKSSGHLVTVTATYTLSDKPVTIEMTTLINQYSSTS